MSIVIPQIVKELTPPAAVAQPAVTVTELDDPTAGGATIELLDQDVLQLHAVPFRARRVTVRLEDAEDCALLQTGEQLYVSDLCRAAGVSERTLEYAFKEIMGLAPMAYLIPVRLHRARRALLAATHGSTTVAAVALDWGFWHFGEFSRAYRECFGELPSDTLRRKPDSPGGQRETSSPRR
jgi:AraC-like DNA-binding protein